MVTTRELLRAVGGCESIAPYFTHDEAIRELKRLTRCKRGLRTIATSAPFVVMRDNTSFNTPLICMIALLEMPRYLNGPAYAPLGVVSMIPYVFTTGARPDADQVVRPMCNSEFAASRGTIAKWSLAL